MIRWTVVRRDDEAVIQVECPGCKTWADVDTDQFEGRVSMDCPNCEYHETHDLRYDGKSIPSKPRPAHKSTANAQEDE